MAIIWTRKATREKEELVGYNKLTQAQVDEAVKELNGWVEGKVTSPSREPHRLDGILRGFWVFYISDAFAFIIIKNNNVATIDGVGDYYN